VPLLCLCPFCELRGEFRRTGDEGGFTTDGNLYRYGDDSPTGYTDPTGYFWSWPAAGIGAAGGAVVGGVGYLGWSLITGSRPTLGGLAGAVGGGAAGGFVAGGIVGAATGDPSALIGIGLVGYALGGITSAGVSSALRQGIDGGSIHAIQLHQVQADARVGGLIGVVTGGLVSGAGALAGGGGGGTFQFGLAGVGGEAGTLSGAISGVGEAAGSLAGGLSGITSMAGDPGSDPAPNNGGQGGGHLSNEYLQEEWGHIAHRITRSRNLRGYGQWIDTKSLCLVMAPLTRQTTSTP
jgi:hypothetical protein